MNEVDEIKSRLNIVDIVKDYVNLKKSGNNYFGLCPFHTEKTPSFSVNERLQIFKCFGCGEGGDVIKFYMKIKPGITFYDCIVELAERAGYEIKNLSHFYKVDHNNVNKQKKLLEINNIASLYFRQNLKKIIEKTDLSNNDFNYVKDYIIKRNLVDDYLIDTFGIGFDDGNVSKLIQFFEKNKFTVDDLIEASLLVKKEDNRLLSKFRYRIVFSIFDHMGRIVGFSGRYVPNSKHKITPPKYINSNDSTVFNKSKILFGFYQALPYVNSKNSALILCEGQMNVISSFKVDVRNVVASLGTSFTEQQLLLISRYVGSIFIAFDKDKAGKKALIRALELILKNSDMDVRVIHWDKTFGKDPDEVINQNKDIWINSVKEPLLPFDYFLLEFENIKNNNDPNIKHRFLKFIIPLINNYKNPVLKDETLKKISLIFGLDFDTVLSYTHPNSFNEIQYQGKVVNNISIKDDNKQIYYKLNLIFFAILMQKWDNLKEFIKNYKVEKRIFADDFLVLFDFLLLYIDTNIDHIIGHLEKIDTSLYQQVLDLLSYPVNVDINFNSISLYFLKKIYKNIAYAKYKLVLDEYYKTQDNKLLEEAKKLVKIFKGNEVNK